MDKQYGDMKRLQEILLLQPSVEHFEQLLSTLFSWVGTESIEEVVARAEEVLSSWPDECREAELFSMHQRLAGFMFDEDALCALSLVRSVRVPLMSFIKTEDLTKVLSVLESCELLSFVVERAVFGEELEHVRQLAKTRMPALKTLSLPESSLSREGVELLIQSDCFPNVQYLDLSQNQMDHNALVAFADSLSFVELHHLDLSGDISAPNDFQKGGMAEFVERSSFQCLQSLNMSYCLLGKGGSEAFARSRVFSSLETLTLRGCQLGREDVEVLACYGHFPLLKTLDLSENKHR
ncbi:MAG TPA: hypothetical protein DCE42_09320 [Myxococcales bacterium]|nr:hypothetical protein [Deltaproteobacteria bacterium]HAA54945.1 hypothetical protein [Myxococcales bacterium]|tara:strand:- start:7120 stop:8001 length:882 start_codon:yes stop_codon:yes gene_type:complete